MKILMMRTRKINARNVVMTAIVSVMKMKTETLFTNMIVAQLQILTTSFQ